MEISIPPDISIRPATIDDFEAVARLLNTYYMSDYEWSFSKQSLRSAWQSPHFQLENDTWIAFTADGQIIGYASMEHDEMNSLTPSVCVLPYYRGRGIEAALFHRINVWSNAHLAAIPNEIEVIAMTRVSGRNSEAQRGYEESGYSLLRTFNIMEFEVNQPPVQPHWPSSIVLSPFIREKDEQAAYEADEEAFHDDRDHSPRSFAAWQDRFSMNDASFDPTLWFLAWQGEEIAGLVFGAVISKRGWIEHVGVRRPWRKQGLGMALMQQILGEFYARGLYTVGLNVDADSLTGANRLYERTGMHVKNRYLIYKKVLQAGKTDGKSLNGA